jgi:predicted transcriptional regulator of viral defense system
MPSARSSAVAGTEQATPVEGAVRTVDDADAALMEVLEYLWRRNEPAIEMRVVRVLEYLSAVADGQASIKEESE